MSGIGRGFGPPVDEAMEALVAAALAEDVGPGDWTTLWTVPEHARGEAVIVAKAPLVVAGMDAVRAVFRQVDPEVEVAVSLEDGREAEEGAVLAEISGRTRSILTGERTALNFLGRLSGIATLTRAFVDAVRGTGARILDTRKTTPGWRMLEKAAVAAGGGGNHRVGLYDMVLIKDNHAAACGGVGEAVRRVGEENRRGLPVEVEVGSLDELETVLPLGVDRILLDNMDLDTMRTAVERTHAGPSPRPLLEASGNVTLDTVRAVALTGVDLISVGALTHSAPGADVSLRMAE